MRSLRGSSPKIASDSVTEPAAFPSSDVTFISMSRALLRSFGLLGRRGIRLRSRRRGSGRLAELAGLRQILRHLLLDCVAHRDPAALRARHRALDHDQPALGIDLAD